jgi:hypothetical protein
VRLLASPTEYGEYLAAAETYWRTNTLPVGPAWIIVEALHQDIRVTLRNLTVANSLRRLMSARVLVVTGTDNDWFEAMWTRFDVNHVRRLCQAFGAEMLDVHELVDSRLNADGQQPAIFVGGVLLDEPPAGTSIDRAVLDANVEATFCRVKRMPRLPEGFANDPEHARVHRRSEEFSKVYEQLIVGLKPIALVTSHVDYNQWGLAVESAIRHGTPVIHTQQTGSLKAYAFFPDKTVGLPTLRAEMTQQIGAYFNHHVWRNRKTLRRSAELVAWRSKANLGRPSWWRGGAAASAELTNAVEREQMRLHILHRFGFDPAAPVVVVFNHAVSDALGTNYESFAGLAEWFEQTVQFASLSGTKANWLMLDHPSQRLYDTTGFFEGLKAAYADVPRMAFLPSQKVPKNILWSIIDLGVTVRGSVSNELPAYGIPVIQAGWSEWSACGLSLLAEDPDSYRALLTASIEGLYRGEALITDEQIERARLWLWFYRCGTDVVSPLVPTWHDGDRGPMLRSLRISMRAVESDGDPAYTAVARMWDRKEPFLTRFDLTSDDAVSHAVPRMHVIRTG